MKKGMLGRAKIPVAVISVILIAAFIINFVLPTFASSGSAILWTDKADYAPEETVHIFGTGFSIDTSYQIKVTRPDGSVVTGNGSFFIWPTPYDSVITDAEGDLKYDYILDGIMGTYTIDAIDALDMFSGTVATTNFTDYISSLTVTYPTNSGLTVSGTISVQFSATKSGGSETATISYKSGSCSGTSGWNIIGTINVNSNGAYSINWDTTTVANGQYCIRVSDSCASGGGADGCDSDTSDNLFTVSNVVAQCGNGDVEVSEACDDNNTANGDGCSSACAVESGYSCTGEPSFCTIVCGNGIVTSPETCDDGNTANSDGCSSTCTVEQGWSCTVANPSVCTVVNPTLSSSCGIDIALIIDNSGSISDSELTTMKTAFKGFVDAFLPNTPTQMAVVKFNTNGDLVLDYSGDATTIKNSIDSVAISSGFTNWQDGLKETYDEFDNSAKPDLYVFASDGNPNRYGDPAQTGTEPVSVAQAVLKANQIKLSGARIITLGIGLGTGGAANLQAISSADAYYSSGFDTLADTLSALADDLCGGTITVKKLVDGNPASGWVFDASATGGTVSPTASTTGADGFINPVFGIDIPGTSATASVSENIPVGYGFVSASCINQNQQPVGSCSAGACTGIVVGKNDAIYCEFQNTAHECEQDSDCDRFDKKYCTENVFTEANYICEANKCVLGQVTDINCDDGNPCTKDSCDAILGCIHTDGQEGTSCNGDPSGLCDSQDTCQSGVCVDNIQPNEYQCRAPAGDCDSAEFCDGISKECPIDSFLPGTTECRAKNGACDVAEFCTGTCPVCPSDAKSTALCRASTGQCDVDEFCNGIDNGCPSDAKASLSTPCDDGLFCSETDHCDGQGNCVQLTAMNCGVNNLAEIAQCAYDPDNRISTFDYAAAFTSVCVEGIRECTTGSQTPSHTCADADGQDGVPAIPVGNGVRTCSAECDGAGTECQPYVDIADNYCNFNGICNTDPASCACDYANEEYCPLSGTVYEGNCYWGVRECVNGDGQGGCTLNVDSMGCNNVCDPALGPKDTTGPATSNLKATKYPEQCKIKIEATETDTCSNIVAAEYFLGGATCGDEGTGDSLNVVDGDWNDAIEDVIATNIIVSDTSLNVHVRGKDASNNWGPCMTIRIDIDCIAPDYPTCVLGGINDGISLNGQCNPNELLVCGSNPLLTASICDSQSRIQLAEYFIDENNPLNWHGINMSSSDGAYDERCEYVNATVNISLLSEGTHYLQLHGKDGAENWGKFDYSPIISFIKDTTAPTTTKAVDEVKVLCGITNDGDNPVEQCWYMKQGTEIHLSAVDPDPQGTEEFAGVDKIMCQFRWKLNSGDSWSAWSAPAECPNPIVFNEDSYHEIRYWAVDNCGNAEAYHYEIDIVDTKAPAITTSIVGPQFYNSTDGKQYIDGVTLINVESTDPQPHPVDDVTCSWSYMLDGQGPFYVDSQNVKQEGLSPYEAASFNIDFPEETTHTLTITCKDALGNTNVSVSTYHVDETKPTTTKTYGTPFFTSGPADYINSSTPITLTVVDAGPHKSGIKETKYRVSLVDDEYCANANACADATGTGSFTTYTTPFVIGEESCHLIEYYSVDNVNKTEATNRQCVYVENKPPVSQKTLDQTQHDCNSTEEALYGITDCSYITKNTQVKLTCDDQQPHPSGYEVLYYTIEWMQNWGDGWTLLRQGSSGSDVEFTYSELTGHEDSFHKLTWYCVDALEQKETPHVELDIVDTKAPVSQKQLGAPNHTCNATEQALYYPGMPDPTNGCNFINQSTPITLTCTDQSPHPVDHVKIYYKDYLFSTCNGDCLVDGVDGWTVVDGDTVTIYKNEDSAHVLEWYCVDQLGNKESTHIEYDIVDSQAPVTTKELLGTSILNQNEGQQVVLTFEDLNGCTYLPSNYAGITWSSGWFYCNEQNPYTPHSGMKIVNPYAYGSPYPAVITFPQPVAFDGAWFAGYGTMQFYGYLNGNLVGTSQVLQVTSTPTFLAANFPGPVDRVDLYSNMPGNVVMDDLTYTIEDAFHAWITQGTMIDLTCTDAEPHPVDHQKIYYRYNVDGGQFTAWVEYTQPFNYTEDSMHTLEYFCNDTLGNTEVTQVEIDKVDTTSPTTVKEYLGPFYTDQNGAHYIDTASTVQMTATDGGAICHIDGTTTYYNVDLVADSMCLNPACDPVHTSADYVWSTYEGAFPIAEESCHMIEYYSVDALGNKETVKAQCVYVDKTPPTITKTYGTPFFSPNGNSTEWINSSTPITLTVEDTGPHKSGIKETKYRVSLVNDEFCTSQTACGAAEGTGSFVDYTTPFNVGEDSCHLIEYYAKDNVDKTDGVHKQCVYVDNKAPISTKTFDGVNIPCNELSCANEPSCDYYINQSTKIELSCTDQLPHPVDNFKIYYRYLVDDVLHQDWTQYTTPIQYDEDSKHTLEWYCVDALNNTEATHTQIERVDTAAPVTTKTIGTPSYDNGYWVTSSTPITLTVNDEQYPCASGESKLYYTVSWDKNCDGDFDDFGEVIINNQYVHADPQTCTLSKTLYLQGECLHQIKWHAVDALGNVEQEHVQLHKVDNTPPHILILKPVDGWYSDGEDIPTVAIATDLNGKNSPCEKECRDQCGLGTECATGIADGTQCDAYLMDLQQPSVQYPLLTEGTFLYNAAAGQCQGYVTIPQESEIPDGIVILVVSAKDNLGNEANSLDEIHKAIADACGQPQYDLCEPSCVRDALQDIVTIWNLPKIGIDNNPIDVEITSPETGTVLTGSPFSLIANISDSENGQITSGITSGTPCYVTIGGISVGAIPYSNDERKCTGVLDIPYDFPQGTQSLKVEIADNAGNMGSDIISVRVDTIAPQDDMQLWKDDVKQSLYYDTDGTYLLNWNGGYDANFDHYELYENDVLIYNDNENNLAMNDVADGTYEYEAYTYDVADWSAKSNKITVIVDTVNPAVDITGTISGLGFFIATYSVTDASPSSGLDRIEVSATDGYALCSGTLPTGFCTVFMGTTLTLTAYDKAGNSGSDMTEGEEKDITPPTVVYTSPSGVITYNNITLKANVNEPSDCYYGAEDNFTSMTLMNADAGKINHTAYLGVLEDGLHVYHVMCEDLSGNMMDSSKTVVFSINTDGQYCYREQFASGWNTFFLPNLILDQMNFSCNSETYGASDVLAPLAGDYDVAWYYDGAQWLYYDPMYPEYSTLTAFNDAESRPYYIYMNTPAYFGLKCNTCEIV